MAHLSLQPSGPRASLAFRFLCPSVFFVPWFPSPQKFWLLILWSLCSLDPSLQAPLAPSLRPLALWSLILVSWLQCIPPPPFPSTSRTLSFWLTGWLSFLPSWPLLLYPSAPLAPISMPLCPSSPCSPYLYAPLVLYPPSSIFMTFCPLA